MRVVSRDGGERRSSGDRAGVSPAETDLKEDVEASTFAPAVGTSDPRLTRSTSKHQIVTSGLLSSPVAS